MHPKAALVIAIKQHIKKMEAILSGQAKPQDCYSFQKVLCGVPLKTIHEVHCKLCQVKLAYHKSTTTMHSHLRVKHLVRARVCVSMQGGGSGERSSKNGQIDPSETPILNLYYI